MYLSNVIFRSRKIVLNSIIQTCKFSRSSKLLNKNDGENPFRFSTKPFSIFNYFKRKISPEQYKVIDKVPQEFELIYRCTMERYFKGAQIACSIIIAVVGLTVLTSLDEPVYEFSQKEVEETRLDNAEDQLIYFAIGLAALNASILFFVTKFPLRVYFNGKNYLAISLNGLPLQTSRQTFEIAELKSKGYGMLPWKEFTYKMRNGRTIILLDQYFRRPYDMNVMMGYTKLET